jgi:hypothetical protein
MPDSFGIVEDKLREAEFFLDHVHRTNHLSFDGRCFFSAFVSAARSVTFAMQASLKGIADFDQWYDAVRTSLKTDHLAPYFVEIRNGVVHKGRNPLDMVTLEHLSNHLSQQFGRHDRPHVIIVPDRHRSNRTVLLDATQACTDYFTSLVSITFDCYERFKTVVNSRWYFTEENFQSMGRTFEDALTDLGFPSDWASGSPVDAAAWRALRLQQSPCQINDIFWRYLSKTISDPDDEIVGPKPGLASF